MSEIVSLPDSWILTTINEVCDFHAGFGFPTEMQGVADQDLPFYKVKDVSIAWLAHSSFLLKTEHSLSYEDADGIKAKPVPEGAVVFAKIGEALRLNRRAIVPRISLIDNNLMGISASPTWLADRYLYWFTIATKFDVDARASVVPSIRKSDVGNLPFPLPPLAEQIRIVAKLEELLSDLDAGVAELKAAQKKLAQYRQSLLKAAVEGALTAEWRQQHPPAETGAQLLQRILTERRARWEAKQLAKFKEQGKTPSKDWQKKYPEPVQPDTSGLPDLPQGWVWASVDQCSLDDSAITDGPFGSNLKSSHYQASGPRVIRLQNIGDGVFVDAMAHIAESHYSELLKHAVQKDDLAIAMLGEILPRACIIPSGVAPAIAKADCARVRVNKCLMKPALLAAQLNSKPIRDAVIKFVKGIGRPRINLGHIRAIPIALCSVDEQSQLEVHLLAAQQAIDRQNEAINLSLKQSTAQRQNILRAAFSGQLVPQDPADEPASVLLARIRAERAAHETTKKPHGRPTKGAA